MEEKRHEVEAQLRNGEIVRAQCVTDLKYVNHQPETKLTVEISGRELSNTAGDYFDAMCGVRLVLEQEGTLLRCYGASLNVYPSGLMRDMALGLKAYKHTLGCKGKSEDIVSIFDSGPDVQPATVAEQKAFWKSWLESIGWSGAIGE